MYVRAMNGLGVIRFVTEVKQGRGMREVSFDLSPELICRLADVLRATRGHACDTSASRIADVDSPMQFNVGHAIWHMENPERAVPCIDPSKVIDLRSLPSGDIE